jgi:hypothetical protein
VAERNLPALIKGLEALGKSPEWELICESLDASAKSAVYELGRARGKASDAAEFIAGAIWAFDTLKSLPDKIRMKATNDLMLQQRVRKEAKHEPE